MMNRILVALLLVFPLVLHGQEFEEEVSDQLPNHWVKVFAETPVQYGIGYELRAGKHWLISAQAGILSEPNSTMILWAMEEFGTDPIVVEVIESAFTSGTVLELDLGYSLGKRNYVATYVQGLLLTGEDTPSGAIGEALNEDLTSYPRRNNRPIANETVTVKSNLIQLGLLYGHRFPLSKDKLELIVEFGISANISSSSELESDQRDYSTLNATFDTYLANVYQDYAFIPSLSIGLAYGF